MYKNLLKIAGFALLVCACSGPKTLQDKLTAKQVTMTLTDEAFDHLLNQGFTRDYGAREMDRVIGQQLKPLLMKEILFGKLKQGGSVTIEKKNDGLAIG